MVLMDVPTHVGCLLDVRIIGVIEAEQKAKGKWFPNDRLIGVAVHSYAHADVRSLDEVSKSLLDQVEEFFEHFNKSKGKEFKLKGRKGPKRAATLLEKGIKAAAGKNK